MLNKNKLPVVYQTMQKDLSPETMLSSQKHSSLEDLFYHFLLAPTHICPEKSYKNKAHNTLAF